MICIYTEMSSRSSLYTCCRDGIPKENVQPKEKCRKPRKSRKLDTYCISRMMVTKGEEGNVCVKYIRTHTNHAPGINELKHVPLSQAVREEVRQKYGQNVQLDSILDGMF